MARADDKPVRATVAKGRSYVDRDKTYGPGEEVTLPEPEVLRLRALGFLVDPGAAAVESGNGPTFAPADGPRIQVAQ